MGNFRQELIRKVQFRVSLNQQFVEQPGSKTRMLNHNKNVPLRPH